MTFILENLFSWSTNSEIFREYLFSLIIVSKIFLEDLFSRIVSSQTFHENLFLQKRKKIRETRKKLIHWSLRYICKVRTKIRSFRYSNFSSFISYQPRQHGFFRFCYNILYWVDANGEKNTMLTNDYIYYRILEFKANNEIIIEQELQQCR